MTWIPTTVALGSLGSLSLQPSHELLHYHFVDDFLDVPFLGHKPSAAGVPELLRHREGLATLPEVLAVLLRTWGPAGGWCAQGLRRPRGSGLAVVVRPPALLQTAGG